MKCDMLLAGVGGQGVLSIAAVFANAAFNAGLFVRQSDIHGMAQRGGAVSSHLRISSAPIASDVIPEGGADIVLSMEALESLRYMNFLSAGARIIAASETIVNIDNYPSLDSIRAAVLQVKGSVFIDAGAIARQAGNAKTVNMAMAGAASAEIDCIKPQLFEEIIAKMFVGRFPEANIAAFRLGREG